MKKLDLNQMEVLQGGCAQGWIGFGVLVAVGVVAVAATVSTGGAAAVLLATGAGKLTAAGLTAGGVAAVISCEE